MKKPPPALCSRLLENSEDVFSGKLPRLEDVAVAVGVSRATLYYYFAGHDDLRGFLIAEHVEGGAKVIAEADTPGRPDDRLRQVLAAMVRYLGERPGFCTGLLGSVAASGELGAALRLNDSVIGEPVRELLRQGIDEGQFDAADVRSAADAILGAVLFSVIGRAFGGSAVDDEFARAIAAQLVAGVSARTSAGA